MKAKLSKRLVTVLCATAVLCWAGMGFAGKTQDLFKEYMENRPDTSAVEVGNAEADKTFISVADSYGTTIDVFDKYSARVENSKVALIGEEVRKEKGDDAYKEYVLSLKGEDKKQYNTYLKNETNTLAVVGGYLKNAIVLQDAVGGLDATKLVSNPFKIKAAASGVNQARKQSSYTVKTLKWLNKTQKVYKAAQSYKGK